MCTSVWEGGTQGLDVLMHFLESTGPKLWILVLGRISTSSAFSVCPFRAAESGNFEAAVKLSLAYLYNEGCECGGLSWGSGERGTAQGGFTLLCLGTVNCQVFSGGAGKSLGNSGLGVISANL